VAYGILYRLEMLNIILLFIIHRFRVLILLKNNGIYVILSHLAVFLRLRSSVCTKNKLYKNYNITDIT